MSGFNFAEVIMKKVFIILLVLISLTVAIKLSFALDMDKLITFLNATSSTSTGRIISPNYPYHFWLCDIDTTGTTTIAMEGNAYGEIFDSDGLSIKGCSSTAGTLKKCSFAIVNQPVNNIRAKVLNISGSNATVTVKCLGVE